jgi:hypothetical protein
LGDDGHVHSLQKGLRGAFTAEEFDDIMQAARARRDELMELVDSLEQD